MPHGARVYVQERCALLKYLGERSNAWEIPQSAASQVQRHHGSCMPGFNTV
jgi:hypothetical protein